MWRNSHLLPGKAQEQDTQIQPGLHDVLLVLIGSRALAENHYEYAAGTYFGSNLCTTPNRHFLIGMLNLVWYQNPHHLSDRYCYYNRSELLSQPLAFRMLSIKIKNKREQSVFKIKPTITQTSIYIYIYPIVSSYFIITRVRIVAVVQYIEQRLLTHDFMCYFRAHKDIVLVLPYRRKVPRPQFQSKLPHFYLHFHYNRALINLRMQKRRRRCN